MDKHLDAEARSDYAEGLMDGPGRAAADAHLAGCAECRRELAAAQAYFRELGGLEPAPAPADFLAKVRARLPQPASPWRRLWSDISSAMRWVPMPIAVAVILGITAITVYLRQGGTDHDSAIPMSAPASLERGQTVSSRPEAAPKPGPASERKTLEALPPAAPAPLRKTAPAYEPGPIDASRLSLKKARIAGRRSRPAEIDAAPEPMAKSEPAPSAAPGGMAAVGSRADRPDFAPSPAKPGPDGPKAGEASGAAPEGKQIPYERSETPAPHAVGKAKGRVAASDAAADHDAAASPFGYVLSLKSPGDSAAVLSGLRAMGVRCEAGPAARGERAYLLKVPAGMFRELAPYLSRYGTAVPQGARPAAGEDSLSVRLRLRLPGS